MGGFLASLYEKVRARPALWAAVLLGLLAVVGHGAWQLRIEEDITRTLPETEQFRTYQRLYRNSSVSGNMVLAIGPMDSTGPYALMDLADSLHQRLRTLPDTLVKEVLHSATDRPLHTAQWLRGLPYLIDAAEMDTLALALTDSGLEVGFGRLASGLAGISSMVTKEAYAQDPLMLSAPVLRRLDRLRAGTSMQVSDGYFFTPDGRYVLVFVSPTHPPTETKANAALVALLEAEADSVRSLAPGKEVLLFGGPVIAVTNARQIREDSTKAGIMGGVLIVLLLLFYFRSIAVPFIFLLPAVCGMLSAAAVMAWVQGSVSALALGAGSVVLGVAMDYAFHFLNHYRHTGSVQQTLREVAFPLVLGSATTVFALFALRFLHSEVLRDLGTFGALTLAFTALFVLVVMPHLARLLPSQPEKEHSAERKGKPLLLPGFLIILVVTAALWPFADEVRFEDDLNRINYFPEHLQRAQDIISGPDSMETVFVTHTSTDLLTALGQAHRLRDLVKGELEGKVTSSVSVADLLPTPEVMLTNGRLWDSIVQVDGSAMSARVKTRAEKAGFNEALTANYDSLFGANGDARAFLTGLLASDPLFSSMYFTEGTIAEGRLYSAHTLISTIKVRASEKNAVTAILTENGFDIVARASLAQALVNAVSRDLNDLLLLTGGMVSVVLLLTYGRFELAFITFLPMVISWVWIMGICGLTGIRFNMVNVLITTFIFGLGDDFAIFISDGFLSRYRTGADKLRSYRSAILLSAATTIIGTGVLVVAQHPALRSIAILSVTGMVCVVVVSLLLQPVLYEVFVGYRQRRGLPPLTFLNLITSLISFGWFLIGCVLLSAMLLVVIPLPIALRHKQRVMNMAISRLCMSVVQIMIHARRVIIDPDDLSRPAIIIANHNSFVDLLWIIGYSPKVLLVTNEWVWNSPFFGFFIRYVDYIRAKEGKDFSLEMIKRKVDEGYSIVIFPEGTRSTDGRMGRFKKGAFYLAEELNLDILPLVTHGLHHVLPKGDFVVNRTTITLKFLPRIKPDDLSYGSGYRERQKNISRMFKREFEQLRALRETPHYFNNLVVRNYIYRGPVVEWYVRIKLKLENDFADILNHVPRHGRVYDLGCGYGYLSLMLAYTEDRQRDVIGVDYDGEKVEVARNVCYKGGNVRFKQADLSVFAPKDADCYIIKDVLHYLRPQDQTALLERCAAGLREGGTIIIRDGMRDEQQQKHGLTRLTELFSISLFGFNRADQQLTFPNEADIRTFAADHHLSVERLGNSVTSNVVLVLRR